MQAKLQSYTGRSIDPGDTRMTLLKVLTDGKKPDAFTRSQTWVARRQSTQRKQPSWLAWQHWRRSASGM